MQWFELISFMRQAGLAIAGAACLWGTVFGIMSYRNKANMTGSIIYQWLARRLMWLLYTGAIISVVGFVILLLLFPASAHEGITLVPEIAEITRALYATAPVYIAWLLLLVWGFSSLRFRTHLTYKGWSWFYLLNFFLIAVLISFYVDIEGGPLQHVIFYAFHGFHSIFTLGTVIVLDFIFLSSKSSQILQQHIIPLFPKISKIIWIGLALDSLSVLLIFPEAVILSPRFFFAQTVVGILIMNGILLSGVLTRRMIRTLNKGEEPLSGRWLLFADIAGSISITSWMSITFIDFFDGITFSYPQLLGIYVVAIAMVYTGHAVWEKFDTTSPIPHVMVIEPRT